MMPATSFDSGTPRWPYLLSRLLMVRPDDDLDAILDSHFPDIAVDELDPVFTGNDLKQLVHLIINCVIYATTAHLAPPLDRAVLEGARPRHDHRARVPHEALSRRFPDGFPRQLDLSLELVLPREKR